MTIKLVVDTITKEEIKKLCDWLLQEKTPQLTKGLLTTQLQEKWAKQIGTKYSVFVNSGSSAILLTLSALLQQKRLKNNKIVIPTLSWSTDLSSPMILGLKPLLVDCNLEDLSCDLKKLEELFIKESPACFINVSVLGIPPKMDKIVKLCKKYDVILLEDNCESVGSKTNNKNLGTFGLASFYSFYFGHHLSSIEGGFINTDDKELYEILSCIRNHGWSRDISGEKQKSLKKEWSIGDFNDLYTFYYEGFNFRSTDLQAFLATNQIKNIKKVSAIRYKNFNLYRKLIKDNMLSLNGDDYVSNFAFPVVSLKRDKIVKNLLASGVEIRPIIAGSMGRQPFWIKKYGIKKFKNADLIHEYGFYLPNNHLITKEQIEYICDIINNS